MDKKLDQQLQKALDCLSRQTSSKTGMYLGQGKLRVMHASLPRILPRIMTKVRKIDPQLVATVTHRDDQGMCLIKLGYKRARQLAKKAKAPK